MGQEIIQPSTKDNSLYSNAATTNYGTSTLLYLWDRLFDVSTLVVARAVLEFDLSVIPAGSSITSAVLDLYYYGYSSTNPSGKTVWAYKLSRTDWHETQSTWNIYKTDNNWTSAGGDYVTSTPSGGSTTIPANYGWVQFNVTDIIADAYANSNNAEIIIKYQTENLAKGYSQTKFYSNNYAVDTSLCPKLTVDYSAAAGWANIAKVNGIAAASIAKIYGIAVADIAKINGVAV